MEFSVAIVTITTPAAATAITTDRASHPCCCHGILRCYCHDNHPCRGHRHYHPCCCHENPRCHENRPCHPFYLSLPRTPADHELSSPSFSEISPPSPVAHREH